MPWSSGWPAPPLEAGDAGRLPVVAETWDGVLNDTNGHHVTKEHAFAALDRARLGPVAEGNVGGGTGMICTGSRRHRHGVAAVDAGATATPSASWCRPTSARARADHRRGAGGPAFRTAPGPGRSEAGGSCIVVVATDAPLLPHQLKRLARRAPLGIGRTGGIGAHQRRHLHRFLDRQPRCLGRRRDGAPGDVAGRADEPAASGDDPTEEAVINALIAAETMTGRDGPRRMPSRTTGCARSCAGTVASSSKRLELLGPGAQVELEGPGAARLRVQLVVHLGDRIGLQERVRAAPGFQVGIALLRGSGRR